MRSETWAAIRAALLGAGELLRTSGTHIPLIPKGGVDAATRMDIELEERARIELNAITGVACFGEEFGGNRTDHDLWVLDKIDGTPSWRAGLPTYGSSIARLKGDEGVINAICLPREHALYVAERGLGAVRIRVDFESWATDDIGLADAVFAMWRARGAGVTKLETTEQTNPAELLIAADISYRDRLPKLARIARYAAEVFYCPILGSASYSMCQVAAGALGAYWIDGVDINDLYPGALLVEEAGGVVSDLTGHPLTRESTSIVASANPTVHEFLLARLS
jgi:fructose-1,6-bisphosphatase/inositol monophosphatase family enzyme